MAGEKPVVGELIFPVDEENSLVGEEKLLADESISLVGKEKSVVDTLISLADWGFLLAFEPISLVNAEFSFAKPETEPSSGMVPAFSPVTPGEAKRSRGIPPPAAP